MQAEFDHKNKPVKVLNTDSLRTFLLMPEAERGTLRIEIPKIGQLSRAIQCLNVVSEIVSQRLRKWCINRISKTSIDQAHVDKSLQVLTEKGVDIQVTTMAISGDIKDFTEVKEEKMDELLKTLEVDNVPPKFISAFKRGQFMKNNREAACDWKLVDGQLKSLYCMHIVTLQKDNGCYDMLVAHFEMQASGNVSEYPTKQEGKLAISISQAEALRQYVESSASLFWKQKADNFLMAQDFDSDDMEV